MPPAANERMVSQIGIRGNANCSRSDWEKFLTEHRDATGDLNASAVAVKMIAYTASHAFALKVASKKGNYKLFQIGGGFVMAFCADDKRVLIYNGNGEYGVLFSLQYTEENTPLILAHNTAADLEVRNEMIALFKKGSCSVDYTEGSIERAKKSVLKTVEAMLTAFPTRFEFNCVACIFTVMILVCLGLLTGLFVYTQSQDQKLSARVGSLEAKQDGNYREVTGMVGNALEIVHSTQSDVALVEIKIEAAKNDFEEHKKRFVKVESKMDQVMSAIAKLNKTNMLGDGKAADPPNPNVMVTPNQNGKEISDPVGLSVMDVLSKLFSFVVWCMGGLSMLFLCLLSTRSAMHGVVRPKKDPARKK
jgi:hypothetical protein